jgi:hypothetical protein
VKRREGRQRNKGDVEGMVWRMHWYKTNKGCKRGRERIEGGGGRNSHREQSMKNTNQRTRLSFKREGEKITRRSAI